MTTKTPSFTPKNGNGTDRSNQSLDRQEKLERIKLNLNAIKGFDKVISSYHTSPSNASA